MIFQDFLEDLVEPFGVIQIIEVVIISGISVPGSRAFAGAAEAVLRGGAAWGERKTDRVAANGIVLDYVFIAF